MSLLVGTKPHIHHHPKQIRSVCLLSLHSETCSCHSCPKPNSGNTIFQALPSNSCRMLDESRGPHFYSFVSVCSELRLQKGKPLQPHKPQLLLSACQRFQGPHVPTHPLGQNRSKIFLMQPQGIFLVIMMPGECY